MPKFAVILPAAGNSSRFGDARRKKPFVELKGRPVWVRAAEAFINRDDVAQTIVVISPGDMEFFKEKFQPNLAFMPVEIVAGGAERAASVQNALARVRADVDFVAVHDAARPLLAKAWIDNVFAAAEQSGAAILATPITSTVKRVESREARDERQGASNKSEEDQLLHSTLNTQHSTHFITETVSRQGLWAAQTPQVFRRQLLLDAYAKWDGREATDEAQLVERTGHPVTIVEGSPINIKITTQEDFRIAEALHAALPKENRLDLLHPFADERFL